MKPKKKSGKGTILQGKKPKLGHHFMKSPETRLSHMDPYRGVTLGIMKI